MKAMKAAIIKAASYHPGPMSNMLYMGSMAHARLYAILGQPWVYPQTPLADALEQASAAQVEAAYAYVQPYLAAIPMESQNGQ